MHNLNCLDNYVLPRNIHTTPPIVASIFITPKSVLISRVVRFRDRKQNGGCQGLREGENEELVFNGYRVSG